jgi:small GTP-binding protein
MLKMHTHNGTIALEIWDTAGQERFKSLVPIYSRSAAAIVIVFDICSPLSFDQSQSCFRDYCDTNPANGQRIYFVANKIDLAPAPEVGRNFAESISAKFFQTSAVTGEGISLLFTTIAEDLSGPLAIVVPRELIARAEAQSGCC